MLYTIILLLWLLIGSLTFSFSTITNSIRRTPFTVVKCTILGLISLLILLYNWMKEQEIAHKTTIKLLIGLIAITSISCINKPNIKIDSEIRSQVIYISIGGDTVKSISSKDLYPTTIVIDKEGRIRAIAQH